MNRLVICLSAISMSISLIASADSYNGAVHVVMPYTNEELIANDPPEYMYCNDSEVITCQMMFEDPEEDRDIPGQLENDTAWPGQREDFSDYLFR
jgi:hypothetical protein